MLQKMLLIDLPMFVYFFFNPATVYGG